MQQFSFHFINITKKNQILIKVKRKHKQLIKYHIFHSLSFFFCYYFKNQHGLVIVTKQKRR